MNNIYLIIKLVRGTGLMSGDATEETVGAVEDEDLAETVREHLNTKAPEPFETQIKFYIKDVEIVNKDNFEELAEEVIECLE